MAMLVLPVASEVFLGQRPAPAISRPALPPDLPGGRVTPRPEAWLPASKTTNPRPYVGPFISGGTL